MSFSTQSGVGKRSEHASRCNDLFGHSFEGSAVLTFLNPLLLQLRGVGVPVIDTGAKWRSARVGENRMVYNAVPAKDGIKLESTNIVVSRDPDSPKRLNLIVGDDPVGLKHLRQFLNSGKFRLLSTDLVPIERPQEFKLDWGFNPDIRLTALKMAFAAGSIAFPNEVPLFKKKAREELSQADLTVSPTSVAADLRDHPALDSVRGDLCHVIYIEQAEGCIHAFVQFFGALQFWIGLTSPISDSYSHALLATLDPVTGVEDFVNRSPLRLPPFREGCLDAMLPIKKLNAAAARRGAKVAEMIRVHEIRVDGVPLQVPPKPYVALSWTGDVPRKKT